MHLSLLALPLLLSSLGSAQEPRVEVLDPGVLSREPGARVAEGEERLVPTVFEGFVLEPDGAPAEGAVVVSSAGGKAVTDQAGNFRLEVGVPLDAESVQLTAVGRGGKNLVASSNVALSAASPLVRVGPLRLSSGNCSPSWLPTFGGQPGVKVDYVGDGVYALAVFDDGGGPALYVGGGFTTAGGVAANNIVKWDGSSWSALGSGMSGVFNLSPVNALSVFDDGGGPALYAGGGFTVADDSGDSFVAKWGNEPQPVLSCPPTVYVKDLGIPGEFVAFSVSATDCWDPAPTVVCVPPSGSFFPRGSTLVTCTATDAFGNQATCHSPSSSRSSRHAWAPLGHRRRGEESRASGAESP